MSALQDNVALAGYTTLGLGGPARHFTSPATEPELEAALAWARQRHLAWTILAGGSNVLISDQGFDGLVIHPRWLGVRRDTAGLVAAGASENWDTLVAAAVADGWAGVECLSGIPGTVGATPIQNVGAYGQEAGDTIARVRGYDCESQAWIELRPDECCFGYRTSVFKARRLIVSAVEFRLRPGGPATVRYAELERRLGDEAPTLARVRAEVAAIRGEKAMLPGSCRSAGSFFKNPTVSEEVYTAIAAATGETAPRYLAPGGQVKIPAAWLLERSGFHKGYKLRPEAHVGLSERHVLAIVHYGGGRATEVVELANAVRAEVERRFAVRLEIEPDRLGFQGEESFL